MQYKFFCATNKENKMAASILNACAIYGGYKLAKHCVERRRDENLNDGKDLSNWAGWKSAVYKVSNLAAAELAVTAAILAVTALAGGFSLRRSFCDVPRAITTGLITATVCNYLEGDEDSSYLWQGIKLILPVALLFFSNNEVEVVRCLDSSNFALMSSYFHS